MLVGKSEVKEGFPAFSVLYRSVNDEHHMSLLVCTLSADFRKGLKNCEPLGTTTPAQDHINQKGASLMAKRVLSNEWGPPLDDGGKGNVNGEVLTGVGLRHMTYRVKWGSV